MTNENKKQEKFSVKSNKTSQARTNSDGRDKEWKHPGGKLLRVGPEKLTDDELLAILIGTGTEGRSALQIAGEILDRYFSIYGLMGKPTEELLKIKGLKKVKLVRLIAAYELARRLVKHHENWSDLKPLKTSPESQSNPQKELF